MTLKYGSTTISPSHTVKYGSTALKSLKYGTTEVWKKEETMLSNVSLTTPNASGAYVYQEKASSSFSFNVSDFPNIRITCTYGTVVDGTGEYGTYGTTLELQYYVNSAWKTISTASNAGTPVGGAVGGSNTQGTYTTNYSKTFTINNLYPQYTASKLSLSGNQSFRILIWCRTANAATSASIHGIAQKLYVYATG